MVDSSPVLLESRAVCQDVVDLVVALREGRLFFSFLIDRGESSGEWLIDGFL